MTTVSASSSLSSQQSNSYSTPSEQKKPTTQEAPPSFLFGRCLWLEKIDPKNRRYLMPFIAVGMGALTHLAKESHFSLLGHWRATTSFCYMMNILLIPPTTEGLTHCVSHLKNKKNWTAIFKFRNVRNVFQSTMLFLVSTTFTTFGIKEACQLLDRSFKPLEAGLSAILPWVKGVCRIGILFQIHDVITGWKLRLALNRALADRKENPDDGSRFYAEALKVIKKNHHYLKAFYQEPPKLLKRVKKTSSSLEDLGRKYKDDLMTIVDQALLLSDRQIRYQIVGIFANVLSITTVVTTNSVAIATLIFAASVTLISREFF